MANSTIKNLKEEVEDAAQGFGLSPNLEARFAREPLECEHMGVSYERLAPGFRTPFGHKHNTQEEVYVITAGSGRVKIDDDVYDVRQWDAVRVGPGSMRNFEAGPEGLELIAMGAPKTPPGDADMVQGWWID
jgi:mannose-6-phosphate isomerase-like protein (cupin superfamily)